LDFVKVRKKNQVTIPKKIMDKMSWEDGDLLEVSLVDGEIILSKVELSRKEGESG